ncbi:MAG: Rrf2 family transcriptional regulator [Planctomycetes bacterium]|nr:Rrf2 family transcriptional regulator [Planctomycetota bacterium]
MISQTVEYALRSIVTIAQHDGHPCTAQQISEITQVPAPYLSKLMQRLVRAGVAKSQRGLHGGFVLTKQPSELTIWEVVDAVEPFKRIHECPLGIKSHGSVLCPLHRRLDGAMEMVEKQFRSTTIADVLAEPGAVTPLCQERKTLQIQANLAACKRGTTETKNDKNAKKKT